MKNVPTKEAKAALFMRLRPYDGGICKRKCWEMSASTAGLGLKYEGSGSHGSRSHLLLIFQTECGNLSAISLYSPSLYDMRSMKTAETKKFW